MNILHYSFPPIISQNSRILILGSLPGPESLRQQQYYAQKGNAFWKIQFALWGETFSENYQHRCALILKNKLALWDVFYSASREGALDSNIQNETPNDFRKLFKEYPKIEKLVFNGKKAESGFRKAFPDLYEKMPHDTAGSTSGAHARPLEEKLQNWRQLLK